MIRFASYCNSNRTGKCFLFGEEVMHRIRLLGGKIKTCFATSYFHYFVSCVSRYLACKFITFAPVLRLKSIFNYSVKM